MGTVESWWVNVAIGSQYTILAFQIVLQGDILASNNTSGYLRSGDRFVAFEWSAMCLFF